MIVQGKFNIIWEVCIENYQQNMLPVGRQT